ncbi:MAG: hypothetical protein HUK25_02050, partial [Treponema sp.]|nr:hypothetical protein [Treponema sp.]
REKLAAELAYAKAKEIKVNLYAEVEDSAKITLTTVVTSAKQGYPFQVKYKIDAKNYYLSGWKLTANEKVLEDGKDYKCVLGEGNDVEITVLGDYSAVDVSPVVINQPLINFESLKKSDGTVIGKVLCNGVSVESETLQVGEPYNISFGLDDKNYELSTVEFYQNHVLLSEQQVSDYFDITEKTIYNKVITVKTPLADGVTVKGIVNVSMSAAERTGPKISLKNVKFSAASVTPSERSKLQYSSNKSTSSYFFVNKSDVISIQPGIEEGRTADYYVVYERLRKIPSGMVLQKDDGVWIDTDVTGPVYPFSDDYTFIGNGFSIDNCYSEDSNVQPDENGWLSLGVKVKEAGIHEWLVYAVDEKGVSPEPCKFAAMVRVHTGDNKTSDYVELTGSVYTNALSFNSKIEFKGYNDYFGYYGDAGGIDETEIYVNRRTRLLDYHIAATALTQNKSMTGISEKDFGTIYTDLWKKYYSGDNATQETILKYVINLAGNNEISFSPKDSAHVKMPDYLPGDQMSEVSVFLVDEYGNKVSSSLFEYLYTPKANVYDIALYNTDIKKVKFMTLEEYLSYLRTGSKFFKLLGIVTYSSFSETFVMAPFDYSKTESNITTVKFSFAGTNVSSATYSSLFSGWTAQDYWESVKEFISEKTSTERNALWAAFPAYEACYKFNNSPGLIPSVNWFIPGQFDFSGYY